MSNDRRAPVAHPVADAVADRWSPYWYDRRDVPVAELQSLFEAARWAASSFNEQPWRFIVATREDPTDHARMLGCLVDANQAWAERAPVLALGVVARTFARNGKPNGKAEHDLGLATGALSLEAARRGLAVHLMGGILPDAAREAYGIPEGFDVITAMAIGYAGDPDAAPDALAERDRAPRRRRPLAESLFTGAWERPAFTAPAG